VHNQGMEWLFHTSYATSNRGADRLSGHFHLRLLACITLLALAACTSMTRLAAVPSELKDEARPDGVPGVRFYPQRFSDPSAHLQGSTLRPASTGASEVPVNWDTDVECDLLAVSAGGDRGAFAAGLLNGWSQTGARPRFSVVTGVSVGALIAPFAFLGPRYDHVLREVTLSAGPGKFFRRRSSVSGFLGDGFASSEPLERLLATYVTAEVLQEIAIEYRHGRDLYIMTTDLDAGVPVIWNMGAIAASDSPDALALFRQVMRASAAIPVIVSPVLINATAAGRQFQELHVDGSVAHQVFLYPYSEPPLPAARDARGPCRAFIIMNTQFESDWSSTPRRTLGIGERAMQTLTRVEASTDVDRIFAALQRQSIAFNLAYIDSDFQVAHPRDFDESFMRALYVYGQQLGSRDNPWHDMPPQSQPLNRSASTTGRETPLLRIAHSSDAH
jgi:predicted patatin/cPLA2 family phospholipase